MPSFWRFFIINGYLILSKAFSASIEMIMCVLFFNLLKWCITFNELQILKNHCSLGISLTWLWRMILYCIVGLSLQVFCWGFLHLYSPVILTYNFFCFCNNIFVCFWYQGDGSLIEWFQKCSFLCNFLESFQKYRH